MKTHAGPTLHSLESRLINESISVDRSPLTKYFTYFVTSMLFVSAKSFPFSSAFAFCANLNTTEKNKIILQTITNFCIQNIITSFSAKIRIEMVELSIF